MLVSQSLHQYGPGARDACGVPSRGRRPFREAVARHRGYDEMEGVLRASAVGRGVGERVDHLQEFEDRARPAVGQDHRQSVRVAGADVEEVNVQPVDPGHELRQGIQLRLDRAPVVGRSPVVSQFLHRRQLHTLGPIVDGLAVGPACRGDAPAEFGQLPSSTWIRKGRMRALSRALPLVAAGVAEAGPKAPVVATVIAAAEREMNSRRERRWDVSDMADLLEMFQDLFEKEPSTSSHSSSATAEIRQRNSSGPGGRHPDPSRDRRH